MVLASQLPRKIVNLFFIIHASCQMKSGAHRVFEELARRKLLRARACVLGRTLVEDMRSARVALLPPARKRAACPALLSLVARKLLSLVARNLLSLVFAQPCSRRALAVAGARGRGGGCCAGDGSRFMV